MPRSNATIFETAFATYTTAGILGEGGAARVYRAEDTSGQLWGDQGT
jgi:hypothetical protein